MNYKKIYWDLIRKALARGPLTGTRGIDYELHHAIPKTIGGTNYSYNLFTLTPKEHIFAHDVLARGFKIGSRMTTSKISLAYATKMRVGGTMKSIEHNELDKKKHLHYDANKADYHTLFILLGDVFTKFPVKKGKRRDYFDKIFKYRKQINQLNELFNSIK